MRLLCVQCHYEVDADDLPDDADACPNCGSKGSPANMAREVSVHITWHELRILCIWAENYAHQIGSPGTVYAIAQALRDQVPWEEQGWPNLTLAGEINDLRDGGFDVQSDVPGTE